jgi:hypothetical protein
VSRENIEFPSEDRTDIMPRNKGMKAVLGKKTLHCIFASFLTACINMIGGSASQPEIYVSY